MKKQGIIKSIGCFAILFILVFSFCLPAMASPGSLSSSYSGNTSGLFVITNPDSVKTNTADKKYVISGYGKAGTTVSLYRHNGWGYENMWCDVTIGASGLFMRQIPLNNGKNSILIYAPDPSNGGLIQSKKIEITLLSQSFLDSIKSISVDLIGRLTS